MEFKKFKKEEWLVYYRESCKQLSDDDLKELYRGILRLVNIFQAFYTDKYSSKKRLTDLFEYLDEPTVELLKRKNKKGVI